MLLIYKKEAKILSRDPEALFERLALGDFAARSALLEFDYAQDDTVGGLAPAVCFAGGETPPLRCMVDFACFAVQLK